MSDSDWQAWFERVWTEREERVYRQRFGDLGQGVYTASAATYERFGKQPANPGWLHHGVFACPPHGDRTHWLYVTSGLSNPWNLAAPGVDPSGFSGLGFELCLATPAAAAWAPQLLHNLMAYELLVAVGSYPGAELFEYGNRIPLHGPVTGHPGSGEADSAIRWLLCETPPQFAPSFELPSGRVDLFLLVGVTEAEVGFAREAGQPTLVALLQQRGIYPLTDAGRGSVR